MPQTLYEYGGDGTPLHMALANGFPPETYIPLLEPLTAQYFAFSLPPRPLWTPPPAPSTAPSWAVMATDILAGLDAHNLTDVVGVGHSMGGVATMIAATLQPERFRAVIVLDPTVLPEHIMVGIRAMQIVGLRERLPLVKRALRRRNEFESQQQAFDYWRGKRLFNDWTDEALWHYVHGLTHPNGSESYTLQWTREWEAQYYMTPYTQVWRTIRQLRGVLPVLAIRGTTSNTFFEGAAHRMQALLPEMTLREIDGHGHLFPQSAPDETRAIITEWPGTL